MDYKQFKDELSNLPLILSNDVLRLEKSKQIARNQLYRWLKAGLIVKLKRGVYLLNKSDRKINPSKEYIANQLYVPSYISLEYALGFYGLIPERVVDVTSVTTIKTMRFESEEGRFIYQHIKPEAFTGFEMAKDDAGLTFFLACPEKAVVDFLYLNLPRFKEAAEEQFESSYRLQNLETLRQRRIIEFARLFNNSKLMRVVNQFCKFIRKEAKE